MGRVFRTLVRVIVDRALRFHRAIVIGVHLVLIALSASLALMLRFDGAVPPENWEAWLGLLPWIVAARALVFVPFRLYQGLWRYTSIWDLRNIVGAVALSSVIVYAGAWATSRLLGFPRAVLIIDSILLVSLLGGVRLIRRVYNELLRATEKRGRRVLIYGAGNAGEMVVRDLRANVAYDAVPIGFVDDDVSKVGKRIHGVPVLGTRQDLPQLLERYAPNEVLIAMPSVDVAEVRTIIRLLARSKARITTLPNLAQMLGRPAKADLVRELEIGDLLSRLPIGLDAGSLRAVMRGRRLLVTGAGGSIGSEICRQLAALEPAHLVALDRYENTLFTLLNDIRQQHPALSLSGVIADVTDGARIQDVFAEYRPEVVFHAAAHKHVPLMEANPCEAVKNNVRGSRIVAEAAHAAGVSRFIMISTDKAVRPSSVMGATKRVAELLVRELGQRSNTQFTTVRFGNVLGSNGSVVPLFLEQIRRGGPVTVTHPDMRRFFMLIPEAVQLVLHSATLEHGASTYVLEMGEPIRLADLARDLIRLSGYVPDEEITVVYTGPRPGEKLEEEVVGDDEIATLSPVQGILQLRPRDPRALDGRLREAIGRLERAADGNDRALVFEHLCALVPTFSPQLGAFVA